MTEYVHPKKLRDVLSLLRTGESEIRLRWLEAGLPDWMLNEADKIATPNFSPVDSMDTKDHLWANLHAVFRSTGSNILPFVRRKHEESPNNHDFAVVLAVAEDVSDGCLRTLTATEKAIPQYKHIILKRAAAIHDYRKEHSLPDGHNYDPEDPVLLARIDKTEEEYHDAASQQISRFTAVAEQANKDADVRAAKTALLALLGEKDLGKDNRHFIFKPTPEELAQGRDIAEGAKAKYRKIAPDLSDAQREKLIWLGRRLGRVSFTASHFVGNKREERRFGDGDLLYALEREQRGARNGRRVEKLCDDLQSLCGVTYGIEVEKVQKAILYRFQALMLQHLAEGLRNRTEGETHSSLTARLTRNNAAYGIDDSLGEAIAKLRDEFGLEEPLTIHSGKDVAVLIVCLATRLPEREKDEAFELADRLASLRHPIFDKEELVEILKSNTMRHIWDSVQTLQDDEFLHQGSLQQALKLLEPAIEHPQDMEVDTTYAIKLQRIKASAEPDSALERA